MAYLPHLDNFYKEQTVLLFKEVFALEKIHGTGTKIVWKDNQLKFFSGGENHEKFVALFNQEFLVSKFKEIGQSEVSVFGEGYGGKCQGMSATYGKELKFIAFDVQIGGHWLSVPQAEEFVKNLGLEFVHYVKCSTDLKCLDAERDKDSVQSVRNGCGPGKLREGVVIRPLIELTKNNGERVICKHKRDKFSEIRTPRKVIDINKLQIICDAELVSQEWVTKNRLINILSHVTDYKIEDTSKIISIMLEDIKREGINEIKWSKDVEKIISRNTSLLYKQYLNNQPSND